MKRILFYAGFAMVITATSCQDATTDAASTTNEDTAVLVEDPHNTLEANPVKDTMVSDTVHIAQ